MPIDPLGVATLVERRAGSYPTETRLKELADDSRHGPGLQLDRWFPEEWRIIKG
jgi:hypothetical protein